MTRDEPIPATSNAPKGPIIVHQKGVGDPVVRKCRACGATLTAKSWGRMALRERIEAAEARLLVLNWPEDVCIEVRACARCGEQIAARVAVTSWGRPLLRPGSFARHAGAQGGTSDDPEADWREAEGASAGKEEAAAGETDDGEDNELVTVEEGRS